MLITSESAEVMVRITGVPLVLEELRNPMRTVSDEVGSVAARVFTAIVKALAATVAVNARFSINCAPSHDSFRVTRLV